MSSSSFYQAGGSTLPANITSSSIAATNNKPSQYRAFAEKLRRSYHHPQSPASGAAFDTTDDSGATAATSAEHFIHKNGGRMDSAAASRIRKQQHASLHAGNGGQRYKSALSARALSSLVSAAATTGNTFSFGFDAERRMHDNTSERSITALLVEPIDYEESLRKCQQQAATVVSNLPDAAKSSQPTADVTTRATSSSNSVVMRHMLNFPADDLEVATYKHEKVFENVDDKPLDGSSISKRELDFISLYRGDWRTVRRRYHYRYASWTVRAQVRRKRDSTLQLLTSPQYEVDAVPSPTTATSDSPVACDPVISRFLENKNSLAERDAENYRRRLENRLPTLFTFYPLQQENDSAHQEPLEKRTIPRSPPASSSSATQQQRIRIDCMQLKVFDIEIEPVFASLALYDVQERRKVSENFHFDFNTPASRAWLGGNRQNLSYDAATLARSALFCFSSGVLNSRSGNLVLVVRVEKVLQQGDISDVADFYAKIGDINVVDAKAQHRLEKARNAARQNCERLGKYRMPLAWAAVFLNSNVLKMPPPPAESSSNINAADLSKGGSLDRNVNPAAVLQKGKTLPPNATLMMLSSATSAPSPAITIAPDGVVWPTDAAQPYASNKNAGGEGGEQQLSSNNNFVPVLVQVNGFFRQESEKLTDEDLLRYLADLKRNGINGPLARKLKTFPGTLKLSLSVADDMSSPLPPNCLSPEMEKLATSYKKSDNSDADMPIIREILELPLSWRRIVNNSGGDSGVSTASAAALTIGSSTPPAHRLLRNLLYIYPKSVNFSATSRSTLVSSARNIAVRIQLMRNESDAALPMIIARSAGASSMVSSAYTYVLYHNKVPSWYDEIKLIIPFNVEDDGIDERAADTPDNYHLLFTFYHVSCNPATNTTTSQTVSVKSSKVSVDAVSNNNNNNNAAVDNLSLESPVGYTWLPLMKNSTDSTFSTPMLISGDYNLPLVMERPPPNYSSIPPDVNIPSMMKWLDNHKGLFQLSVRPVSSIHTDEPNLEKFFHLCALAECEHVPHALAGNAGQFEQQLREAVLNLGEKAVDVERLSTFLPHVLDKLLSLIVEPLTVNGVTLHLAPVAFQALVSVVHEICTTADDELNDQHGRNQHLLSFIYYQNTSGVLCRQTPYSNVAGISSPTNTLVNNNVASLQSAASLTSVRESFRLRRRVSTTSSSSSAASASVSNKEVKMQQLRSNSLHSSSADTGLAVSSSAETAPPSNFESGGSLSSMSTSCSLASSSMPPPPPPPQLRTAVKTIKLHEEFALQWLAALTTSTSAATREACFTHSWFLFEYLWQAMANCLLLQQQNSSSSSSASSSTNSTPTSRAVAAAAGESKRIDSKLDECTVTALNLGNNNFTPRSARFSKQFMTTLDSLVGEYSSEIVRKYDQQRKLMLNPAAQHVAVFQQQQRSPLSMLNANFAFFLSDCLALCDRGCVLNWIYSHCRRINLRLHAGIGAATNSNSGLLWLKLDFVRILCTSHEHFVAVNLPTATLLNTMPTTTNNKANSSTSPSPSSHSALSLTSSSSISSSSSLVLNANNTELSTAYRQQHYLLGLVLGELQNVLFAEHQHSSSSSSDAVLLQQHAVQTVLTLLAWHDGDVRYSHVESRQRLAQLYMPLLTIVLDVAEKLSVTSPTVDSAAQNNKLYFASTSAGAAAAVGSNNEDEGGDFATPSAVDPNVLHLIAHGTVHSARGNNGASIISPPPTSGRSHQQQSPKLSFECSRDLLLCSLWLLKCADQHALRAWWETLSYNKLARLLDVLEASLLCFEYRGRQQLRSSAKRQRAALHVKEVKSQLEDIIGGGAASVRSSLVRRKRSDLSLGSTTSGPDDGVRWDKTRRRPVSWRHNNETAESNDAEDTVDAASAVIEYDASVERAALFESTTSAEVGMIVLHTFELLLQVINANDMLHGLLRPALRVLLTALACQQSVAVLDNYYATCRAMVLKFPELLFEDETRYCAELCLKLLTHCSSNLTQVRALGASSLYLLMRQNYLMTSSSPSSSTAADAAVGNFARVKLQATIALSTLVGMATSSSPHHHQQSNIFSDVNLKRSLSAILLYAQQDAELAQVASFTRQVQELIQNFRMILSDTVKMRAYRDDADLLLDLMFRIAKGYQRSPDLRLTWLNNMALKHKQRQCYAEAGMCYVHGAALVAEYLRIITRSGNSGDAAVVPRGCVEFSNVSANILEETALSEASNVLNPDREGICSAEVFCADGIFMLMQQAGDCFHTCGLYESMNAVYRLMLPMLEATCAYERVAAIHERLQKSYAVLAARGARRLFATYFRVGFYGRPFQAMGIDGAEFVYKEPAITKLAEVAHRLEAFYRQQFLDDAEIFIIKDSSQVSREKLPALDTTGYIQVTYVEPYFYPFELRKPSRDRASAFQRNFNLKRFVFATPFTLDGRAHGELHEQYTKRVILTTAEAFPYIKTRIPVVKRDESIQTPIELALDDLKKRTSELSAATLCEPPDTKMLQMVLQGCIGTSVNVGPIRTAQVFLSSSSISVQQQSTGKDLAQDVMDGAAAALANILDDSVGDKAAANNNGPEIGRHYDKWQHKLRLQFKEFARWCAEAIKRNKALIGNDQREYQRELEKNYAHFVQQVGPLLDAANPAIAKSVSIDFANSNVADDAVDDENDADEGVGGGGVGLEHHHRQLNGGIGGDSVA